MTTYYDNNGATLDRYVDEGYLVASLSPTPQSPYGVISEDIVPEACSLGDEIPFTSLPIDVANYFNFLLE